MQGVSGTDPRQRIVLMTVLLGLVFAAVVLRTAWLCDDAYISLRTVFNAIEGYGLRWNLAERVQVFTHPLWVLLLTGIASLTDELYLTTLIPSMLLAVGAFFVIILGLARSSSGALAAGLALILASAFVSFATSGLETPLSYFLMAVFLVAYLRGEGAKHRVLILSLAAGLAVLNRLDQIFLFAPALGLELWRDRSRATVRAVLAGFIPLAAWLLFSLVYYGFLFPNTAYAKVWSGLPRLWYLRHGFLYLVDGVLRESLLALTLAGGVGVGLAKGGRHRALAAGAVLYLLYVVWVGGDFMRGRLLVLPMVVALGILLDVDPFSHRRVRVAAVPVVLLLGLLAPRPTLVAGREGAVEGPQVEETWGIVDERIYYVHLYGLLNGNPLAEKLGHDLDRLRMGHETLETARIKLMSVVGDNGMRAGPGVHMIDQWALADAFLARLPTQDSERIGHLSRRPPRGYLMTLLTGENHIEDVRLEEYYAHIHRVTRGPLFDGARWGSILALNLGGTRTGLRGADDYEYLLTGDYVEFVQTDPAAGGPRILWQAARYYLVQRDRDRAGAILDRLAGLRMSYANDYIDEAVQMAVDQRTQDPDFTLWLLELLCENEPRQPVPAYALGRVLESQGDLDGAVIQIRTAAGMGYERATVWLRERGLGAPPER